jgi:hypothetical protein
MGANAIWKDEAIEEAKKLMAKTIDGLETLVERLTKKLADTKDWLVSTQTIDLGIHIQEKQPTGADASRIGPKKNRL